MSDWLLALLPDYGLWILALATYLSCLAVPMPASLLMLAAGGFAAAGDFALSQAMGAALAGAVAGDQTGFAIGRFGGRTLLARIERQGKRAALVARARALLARGFLAAVFLSRWLVSPAGPWVNLAAGAAGHGWARFTAAGVAGELVWVGLYTGMGHLFVGNLQAAEDLIGSLLGLVGGAAAMVLAGLWLRAAMRHRA
ncbi:DedA family protein [Albidovulum sp.]|uniref:DedA family protein n=1 Tax=Albidovulum sp. TaxID=1872424 RepID=UPI001D8D30AB|nr:VTT domain-containing protein [Paracoccaceae bacterium]MCC0046758.1 VTT domain-containing protein [Defluviimonas sp.]HPE24971.1 VTT domain-containing protein [Albidovulum sp.]MCB2141816.1 VTT domain-containing protein [Paracoccaceae bacterium]MCB2150274.1 VTT domain-containing protein [Paracoccaceae bacterium]